MKLSLPKTIGAAVMLAFSSAAVGNAIISATIYDLFGDCFIPGNPEAAEALCRNGPNVAVFMISSLIFFVLGLVFVYAPKMKSSTLLKLAAFAFLFFWLQLGSWQLFTELSDNFEIQSVEGPADFGQYAFALLARLQGLLIGLILGVGWWLPSRVNKNAIEADKRKEPRTSYKKKS